MLLDITERKQAERAEREALQLAEALRDTATALNTSLELDAVLDRVLVNVQRVVPHDGANIMLIDGDEASVARALGRCQVETIDTERYVISDTLNLRTMRATGAPCIIDHTRDNADWHTLPGCEWIASYAGVPIRAADGQLVGYLGLYSTQPGHFSGEHTQRLKMFAAQAALAIQNAQLHARIQLHAEELEGRVRQRTRQLSEANAQLSELDRLKDQFISRISHELRTPLTSIKIYLELLAAGKPEKRNQYMLVLSEQTDRLQQLIESLLEVTQQGTSAADLHVSPTDLNHLAHSLAADTAPRAALRGLTFNTALAPDLPSISADAILLAQALSNLVSNALNYTPAGGTIDLATAQVIDNGETWITMTIHDTGPGIAPDELPHIFDRFYRGRAAADYKTPGAGVGLFISRDILTALGGRLTADSQPGEGSTFTAWLKPA
jgi:signal transduction histidine kinase